MIRLLRVELTRLRWRRAVILLLIACAVLPLVVVVALFLNTTPPSDAELREAERVFQTDVRRSERQIERCVGNPQRFGVDAETAPEDLQDACAQNIYVPEGVDDYLYSSTIDLDEERGGSGLAVVAMLAVLLFLLGTTFSGHDWNTGSMSNQLLFEPRRLRVWLAKALAVTGVAGAVTALMTTVYWLLLDGIIAARDFPDPRPGALLDCLQQGWRGAAFAALAALGGYALTMLSRSTVFTIGVLFAVSVAGGLLLGIVGPRDPGPLDPTINAQAFIDHGVTYYIEPADDCYTPTGFRDGPECDDEGERSFAGGAGYYGGILLVVCVASAPSFRRRDVP